MIPLLLRDLPPDFAARVGLGVDVHVCLARPEEHQNRIERDAAGTWQHALRERSGDGRARVRASEEVYDDAGGHARVGGTVNMRSGHTVRKRPGHVQLEEDAGYIVEDGEL